MQTITLQAELLGSEEVRSGLKKIETSLQTVGQQGASAVAPVSAQLQKIGDTTRQNTAPAINNLSRIMRTATGPVAAFSLGLGSTTTTVSGLLRSATSAVAMFAGPWSLGVAAAAAGILALSDKLGFFDTAAKIATQASKDYASALDAVDKALNRTSESARKHTLGLYEEAKASIETALATEQRLLSLQQAEQLSLARAARGNPEFRQELGLLGLEIEQTQGRILALTSGFAQLTQSSANLPRGPALLFNEIGAEADKASGSVDRLSEALRRQQDVERQLARDIAIEGVDVEAAGRIHRRVQTPQERARDELAEAQQLMQAGFLSTEDFERLSQKINDDLRAATTSTREWGTAFDSLSQTGVTSLSNLTAAMSILSDQSASTGAKLVALGTALLVDLAEAAIQSFGRVGDGIERNMARGGDAMTRMRDIGLGALGELISAFGALSSAAEGSPLLNSLGIGSGKSPGTFQTVVNWLGFLGSRIGPALFGGASTPSFAGGGPAPFQVGTNRTFNRPTLISVAETEPEHVSVTRGAGTGGPNANRGGGVTINLDLRGSNGDAAIEQAVRKGIQRASPAIVEYSLQKVSSKNKRDPSYLGTR